jgi:ADP-ribosylglycohydrolase
MLATDRLDRLTGTLLGTAVDDALGLPREGLSRRRAQRLFSPTTSGVVSAGNGAAMRAPILGASLAFNPERLEAVARASARLPHRDPRAEEGALMSALAPAYAATRRAEDIDAPALLDVLAHRVTVEELRRALAICGEALVRGDAPDRLAETLGMGDGVSGFVLHTVPTALFCWLASLGDFRRSMETILRMGGDADSTGAIVGGLAGATVGARAIPEEWVAGIWDWPRCVGWMRLLAERLAETFPVQGEGVRRGPLPVFWPVVLPRNLLFLAVALTHGFRRLAPPY